MKIKQFYEKPLYLQFKSLLINEIRVGTRIQRCLFKSLQIQIIQLLQNIGNRQINIFMKRIQQSQWKNQLTNLHFTNDIEKVRKIAYEMETVIFKIDEENNQLKGKIKTAQDQMNKSIQQIHNFYQNQNRQKNDININKQIDELTHQNTYLINQCRKLQTLISAKDQEISKIVNINKANNSQYEGSINHLKVQSERKYKQIQIQLANITAVLNKTKMEKEIQIKKIYEENQKEKRYINELHQKEIQKINIIHNQLKKQREQQVRKELISYYESQISHIKQKYNLDMNQLQQNLHQNHKANVNQLDKAYQDRLVQQIKSNDALRNQVRRLKQINQSIILQNGNKLETLKQEHKSTVQRLRTQTFNSIQGLNMEIQNLKNQISIMKTKEKQSITKYDTLNKEYQKYKFEKNRIEELLIATKQDHEKKTIDTIKNYQNYVQKINNQNKLLITNLETQLSKYRQINQVQQNEINQLQLTKARFQSSIKKLEDDKINLERNVEFLKSQNQRKIINSQNMYELNLQKVINDHNLILENVNNQHEQTIEAIKKQINFLQKNNEQNLNQINKLNDSNSKHINEIRILNEQLSKKQRQIKRLNQNIEKKDRQIQKLNQNLQINLNKINDLHKNINQMITIEEVDRMNQEHQNQIKRLQNQLWSIHQRVNEMIPVSEVERIKERTLQQKKKIGQQYDSVQYLVFELKKKLQENQRVYKESISELKQQHRVQIAQLTALNENKILELKNLQSQQNEKKNSKHMNNIQQLRDDLKQQFTETTNRIKEQYRKNIQDLISDKKKDSAQFQSQIQNLKLKNTLLQRQIQSTKLSSNHQKEQVFEKMKNDEITIANMKSKLQQYDIREKKSQNIMSQLTANIKDLEISLQNKEKDYEKKLLTLENRFTEEVHQRQLENAKKSTNQNEIIENLKKNYENKINDLQKKQTNQKRKLTEKINLLESKLLEKDKLIETIQIDNQMKLNEVLILKEKKSSEEKMFQKKIQQNIQQMIDQKNKEYQQIVKSLELKNSEFLAQIVILESSNKMLREQMTSLLSRGNKEKQLYQQINRLKAQLGNAERRTSQLKILKIDTKNRSGNLITKKAIQNNDYDSETSIGIKKQLSSNKFKDCEMSQQNEYLKGQIDQKMIKSFDTSRVRNMEGNQIQEEINKNIY